MDTLGPDTKFARGLPIRVHRTRGISIWQGPATKSRLPLTPEMNRTKVPRNDGFARQGGLVGDSLDNEEGANDLFVAQLNNKVQRLVGGV